MAGLVLIRLKLSRWRLHAAETASWGRELILRMRGNGCFERTANDGRRYRFLDAAYVRVASRNVSGTIPCHGPEAIAGMSEAFEAALKAFQVTGRPNVVREAIAGRIIAAAKFGERDPARLLAAALSRPRRERD